jgi:hypothetical protein
VRCARGTRDTRARRAGRARACGVTKRQTYRGTRLAPPSLRSCLSARDVGRDPRVGADVHSTHRLRNEATVQLFDGVVEQEYRHTRRDALDQLGFARNKTKHHALHVFLDRLVVAVEDNAAYGLIQRALHAELARLRRLRRRARCATLATISRSPSAAPPACIRTTTATPTAAAATPPVVAAVATPRITRALGRLADGLPLGLRRHRPTAICTHRMYSIHRLR